MQEGAWGGLLRGGRGPVKFFRGHTRGLGFVTFSSELYLLTRERETWVCCSTQGGIHRFILVCSLTGDRTRNLGASGGPSNWNAGLRRCWTTRGSLTHWVTYYPLTHTHSREVNTLNLPVLLLARSPAHPQRLQTSFIFSGFPGCI